MFVIAKPKPQSVESFTNNINSVAALGARKNVDHILCVTDFTVEIMPLLSNCVLQIQTKSLQMLNHGL